MLNLAYSISIALKDTLNRIELLRQNVLLTPISPKTELRLRWEALVNRLYWSQALLNTPITKQEIVTIISSGNKIRWRRAEHDIKNYQAAFDDIYRNWLVSAKPVTSGTIAELYQTLCRHRLDQQSLRTYQRDEAAVRQLLHYVQEGNEHPVVQAAVSASQLMLLSPFDRESQRVALLTGYLFLYKSGFDCRGLLVLEEYWKRNLRTVQQLIEGVKKGETSNRFLEFFAEGMATQLSQALADMKNQRPSINLPTTFFEINDRQKTILSILDRPDTTITNKKVQGKFKISQITASRDLTKLATLGLLYPHGKGRSIYYTKI